MAPRSLSTAKLLASFISVSRRGFSAASHGTVPAGSAAGGSRAAMMRKMEESPSMMEKYGATSAWAPDPVTGYYRPSNCAAQMDAADLRAMLLSRNVRS